MNALNPFPLIVAGCNDVIEREPHELGRRVPAQVSTHDVLESIAASLAPMKGVPYAGPVTLYPDKSHLKFDFRQSSAWNNPIYTGEK